ncbi:MAG: deoxyribonuclease IV [Acidobacteria bacterium]|nr:deoxyribonuclease IV [Acidobacteriota bacterium]
MTRACKIRVGVHTSIAGKISNALTEAAELHCDCVQIFSRNPRGWLTKPFVREDVKEFRSLREQLGLDPVVIHAVYLINLAAIDPLILDKSVSAFRDEVERAIELGANHLVVHPGSAKNGSADLAIATCAASIKEAVRGLNLGELTILIENTAGQGGQIGRTFEQVGAILDHLDGLPVGCCLDTAHTYAAGYDIAQPSGLERTARLVRKSVGKDRLRLVHCNDTKVPLGGAVDRHWHIGQGNIGLEGFGRILNHPLLKRLPFILETPKQTPEDDPRNLAIVRNLATR